MKMGKMTPPSRRSCYNFRVTKVKKVLDGDTIDVVIDLGFDLAKTERVRIAGVDTPEKRTRDLEEKALGIDATNWLKGKLEEVIKGDTDLVIRTELVGGVGKYGRLLGWLYAGDSELSLNEQMITEGYAWEYDGGTKQKNFDDLRRIRYQYGTLEKPQGLVNEAIENAQKALNVYSNQRMPSPSIRSVPDAEASDDNQTTVPTKDLKPIE